MTTARAEPPHVRTVFFGNDPWSVPALQALARAAAIDVVVVVTNPPRPAGRGGVLRPTAVADAARDLGLALDEVETTREQRVLAALRSTAPDVFVVVAYGELLRPDVLAIPRDGAVNLHFSLLPRWRGASPVQHAILAGDAVTGISLMVMDADLDTGPILAAAEVPIAPDDDAGSLGARLADLGATLLPAAIRDLAGGRVDPTPQSGRATSAPKLGPDERRLQWDVPADDVVRRIRAFSPHPGASTMWRGEILKVLRADAPTGPAGPPGTFIAFDASGVTVGAGSGAVRLIDVAPAGRRRMPAVAWARGARPQPGEAFD